MELFEKDSKYYNEHYGEYDSRVFKPVSEKQVSSAWSIDILDIGMIDYERTFRYDDKIYVCLGTQLDIAAKMGSFTTYDGEYIDDLLPVLFQTAPYWEISTEEAIEEGIIPDDLIAESGIADKFTSGIGETYIYVQIDIITDQFRYVYVNNQDVCAVDIDSLLIDDMMQKRKKKGNFYTYNHAVEQKKRFTNAVRDWLNSRIIK